MHLPRAAHLQVILDHSLTCKVADFGHAAVATPVLTRNGPGRQATASSISDLEMAHTIESDMVAIRWAAVEVLADQLFSTASDIWATGVLIYEVMSDGVAP